MPQTGEFITFSETFMRNLATLQRESDVLHFLQVIPDKV